MKTSLQWISCNIIPQIPISNNILLLTDGINIGTGHYYNENGHRFFGCDTLYNPPTHWASTVFPLDED